MKKSMRMVSVLMSAVMAMSAMSALAAGASAEELPAEPEVTITDTTGYDPGRDVAIDHDYIPVVVNTDGINGRLKSMTVTFDYEFTAKANSPEVRGILFAHPKTKRTDDGNGNVTLHVTEKRSFTTDDEIKFNVPANVDMQKFSVKIGYVSSITGSHDFLDYCFADSHINSTVYQIAVELDATSYFFYYDVTGSVYVNGALVHTKKD